MLGLAALPEPGDQLLVVTDSLKAQSIVDFRQLKLREKAHGRLVARSSSRTSARAIAEGQLKELPLVVKADVQGSVEAVTDQLMKIPQEKIKLRIIRSGAGAITEGDVLLAAASNAVVIGFNVRPERKAAETAERDKVEIRLYTVIYDAVEDMKKAMEGLLEPTHPRGAPGRGRGARHLQDLQGRAPSPAATSPTARSTATRRSGCCATTWSSTPARCRR